MLSTQLPAHLYPQFVSGHIYKSSTMKWTPCSVCSGQQPSDLFFFPHSEIFCLNDICNGALPSWSFISFFLSESMCYVKITSSISSLKSFLIPLRWDSHFGLGSVELMYLSCRHYILPCILGLVVLSHQLPPLGIHHGWLRWRSHLCISFATLYSTLLIVVIQ